jgi:hypothetical protein
MRRRRLIRCPASTPTLTKIPYTDDLRRLYDQAMTDACPAGSGHNASAPRGRRRNEIRAKPME